MDPLHLQIIEGAEMGWVRGASGGLPWVRPRHLCVHMRDRVQGDLGHAGLQDAAMA